VRLQDLAHVHAGRDAEGIQDDLDRSAVGKPRHVFLGRDPGDDPLVPVTAGDLVAHGQLALHGDEDLDGLDDAGGQFVPLLEVVRFFLEDRLVRLDLALDLLVQVLDFLVAFGVFAELDLEGFVLGQGVQDPFGQFGAFLEGQGPDLLGLFDDLPLEQRLDLSPALRFQDGDFIVEVPLHRGNLVLLDGFRPGAFFGPPSREDPDVDDGSLDAGRTVQGGVLDVQGLLPEDRLEELLFGRKLRFALGSDLPDEDIAGLDLGPDPDDAVFVEVPQEVLGNVGNVAGDFFRSELRVPGLDGFLHDVDGTEDILLDELLADDDRILVVVPSPGHERAEDVPAEGKLPPVRTGAVGENLSPLDPVSPPDDGPVVDAGVLVGPEELDHGVEVRSDLVIPGVFLLVHPDQDALGVHELDDAGPFADDHVARSLGHEVFDARPDQGRFGPEERDGLALHVRAHQGPVGVIVLQEGNQRGRKGDKLLGRDVDVIDLLPGNELGVPRFAGADQILCETTFLVDVGVGLGDGVLLLFPGGQVPAVGFENRHLLALLRLERFQGLDHVVLLDDLPDFVGGAAGMDDLDGVDDLSVPDLAVGRFEEAVAVDAGVAAQGGNQPDVRAFGRLDRADPSVVRGLDVADFETGPVPAQASWPEGAQAALVGDFRQAVDLIHELGELGAPEEFLEGGDDRL